MDTESQSEGIIDKYKIPVMVGVVGFVLLIGGIISSGIVPKTFLKSSKQLPAQVSSGEVSGAKKVFEVKVDVSGAVATPGVYTLPVDARVEDAIKAAGGVLKTADPVFISKTINLAQKISDGMKIYVPTQSENFNQTSSNQTATSQTGQTLININNADLSDLDKLLRVGAVTAQKIIDNRPYSGIEELVIKKAVSRSVYEQIKGLVTTW
jgi:competence protein ComEA